MDRIKKEPANLDPESLNELPFADDQSLTNEDEKAIQEHMSNLKALNFRSLTNLLMPIMDTHKKTRAQNSPMRNEMFAKGCQQNQARQDQRNGRNNTNPTPY